MTPPKLHKAPEAGAIVGKSASWMYKMGAAGLIPRTKIGHHVGWTDEQCAQIIRNGAQEPKSRKQQNREQRNQKAAKADKAEASTSRKRNTAPPATAKNIPVADRSVSRLYRNEEPS
ncbi:hypothetical protein JYK22_21715, partial [Nonomuraea sp. RK-328]|nr:hypothetical protein [Nonomuraea sp. RK-328]